MKKYICNRCGSGFGRKYDLDVHKYKKKVICKDNRKEKCISCKMKFITKKERNSHQQECGEGKMGKICNKLFELLEKGLKIEVNNNTNNNIKNYIQSPESSDKNSRKSGRKSKNKKLNYDSDKKSNNNSNKFRKDSSKKSSSNKDSSKKSSSNKDSDKNSSQESSSGSDKDSRQGSDRNSDKDSSQGSDRNSDKNSRKKLKIVPNHKSDSDSGTEDKGWTNWLKNEKKRIIKAIMNDELSSNEEAQIKKTPLFENTMSKKRNNEKMKKKLRKKSSDHTSSESSSDKSDRSDG